MSKEDVRKRVTKLIRETGRNNKYLRNLKMYNDTPISSLDDVDTTVGFYNTGTARTSLTNENVVLGTISTLVAKLAEHARARPFINTVNGNFHDKQVSRAVQQYFDTEFDTQNVYDTVSSAFRDACIFDTGYVFIDKDEKKIKKLYPWQVYFDNKEQKYGCPKTLVIVKKQYPVTFIEDYKKPKSDYVTLLVYWDTVKHKKYTLIKEDADYWKEEDYKYDVLPILPIKYEESSFGSNTSVSVVDLLYSIQKTINEICIKMGKRIRASASIITIPTNGGVKEDKLTNEEVQIIPYEPAIGASAPMSTLNPDYNIEGLRAELEAQKRDAYDLVGVNMLSVTGQQTAGMDDMSGVAMQTMANIEADRFQTQLNKIIRLYVDIARRCIDLYEGQVLPDIKERLDVTWDEVRNTINKFKIQFSAAANISKDPAEKWKIIKEWKNEGLIPANRITGLLEIPDLQEAASFAANSYNAIQTVIEDCIEKDVYDIPPYISREELKPEIMNTCLMLTSLGPENQKDIEKLKKLFNIVVTEEYNIGNAQKTDEANAQLDNEANVMDEQSTFLEMQSQQLTSVLTDLQNGVIDKDQATAQLESMGSGSFDYAGV